MTEGSWVACQEKVEKCGPMLMLKLWALRLTPVSSERRLLTGNLTWSEGLPLGTVGAMS